MLISHFLLDFTSLSYLETILVTKYVFFSCVCTRLKIVDLNLAATSDELEHLISSALSSDITLFEKISCGAYRLRIHPVTEEAETFDLDSEDFGSVDNDSKDNDIYSSDDDSECSSDHRILDQGSCHEKGNKTLTVYTEIDESHPGEVWLLGLVEGEYSDLSIDEKLNALVALVDLLSAGSSIRMEVIPLCRTATA